MVKVSVIMITYNHEKYIKQAIDGVLLQKCDFDVELIIANDKSPDNTDAVVKEVIKYHPRGHRIKYTRHSENKGMQMNFKWASQRTNGEYIALCEGDDYWTDPLKLQKQVDFMEENEEYTMSFHSVHIKNEIPGYVYSYPIPKKTTLSFNDLLNKHFIPTCSILFRKEVLPTAFPDFFSKCMMGDIPLELMLADKGKVYFFREKMGTYRLNIKGVTQDKNRLKKGRNGYIFVYNKLIKYFFPRHFLPLAIKLLKTKAGFLKDVFLKSPRT